MMTIFAELLTMARLVDNYEADATSGTLWSSTTLFLATVPTGKRWFWLGGTVNRSDASTVAVTVKNAAGKVIYSIDDYASATAILSIPANQAGIAMYQGPWPIPLDAGYVIQVAFGTAQGATATAALPCLEIDVQ